MKYLIAMLAALALSGSASADDALAVVNAQRAARGLPAFLPDPGLQLAAERAAAHRAASLMFAHTVNDFQFLPPGCSADAAGCAAYPASYGFMACATYDRYTYAGAASVLGRDGKTYHHLFVSRVASPYQTAQQGTTTTTTTKTTTVTQPKTPAVAPPKGPVVVVAAPSPTITTMTRASSSTSVSYRSSSSSAVRGRLVRTPVMDRAFGPPARPVFRGLIKIGIAAAVIAAL